MQLCCREQVGQVVGVVSGLITGLDRCRERDGVVAVRGNFQAIPFNTRRSSNRGRPITDRGNNGSNNAHSTSDSS